MTPHSFQSLEYFTKGTHPQILFISGMHGDEYETGMALYDYFHQNSSHFPPFFYIPQIAPTAVSQKTRQNIYGSDINRQFLASTIDKEAVRIMELLKDKHFRVAFDIHEDPDLHDKFYLYDSEKFSDREKKAFYDFCRGNHIDLFTGIDDQNDPNLGDFIDQGYYSFEDDWKNHPGIDAGFFSKWAIRKHIIERVFTLEFPGKADTMMKQNLIAKIIPFVVETFV